MGNAVRVCLADAHPVVRIGMRALLEQFGADAEIVAEARNGGTLLSLLAANPDCDIVITDYFMPVGDARECGGIPLLQAMQRQYPSLRVVVLTMIENPVLLQAILDAGAHGLVDKVSSPEEVLQALRDVVAGRRHVSQKLRGLLQVNMQMPAAVKLSPHEAEVVRLFVRGLTVTEIAARLSRSVKTISRQKSDAMRKLGLGNHSELYAYARDCGLAW